MRSLTYLTCALLFACTDRPLDDSGGTSGSTGAAPSTSSSSAPTTGIGTDSNPDPTETPSPTTGPGTTTADTTTPTTATSTTSATTTTTDPSTATTDVSTTLDPSDTNDPKFDLPSMKPAGIVGCTLEAPPGTDIKGPTRLGPFTGDRAYFGITGFGNDILTPFIMILAPGADPLTEFQDMQGATGTTVSVQPLTDPYDQWAGEWQTWAQITKNSMFANSPVNVVITGFAGNWDAPDPGDPPRVVGSFEGELAGSFDAVYCDKLDIIIIPE